MWQTLQSWQLCIHRNGFTVKLTGLKLQGPSITQAFPKALGKALNKYSPLYRILYSFSQRGPQKLYKTWICLCTYILMSIYIWHMGSKWYTSDLHSHHWQYSICPIMVPRSVLCVKHISIKWMLPGDDTMIPTSICCKSLATQEPLDGSKGMKINGPKLSNRLVTFYGTTNKKLHANLPTVPICDSVIQSPTKCCFNINFDVTKCRSNMYHLLSTCTSYTN
jgi:hypothetical protein